MIDYITFPPTHLHAFRGNLVICGSRVYSNHTCSNGKSQYLTCCGSSSLYVAWVRIMICLRTIRRTQNRKKSVMNVVMFFWVPGNKSIRFCYASDVTINVIRTTYIHIMNNLCMLILPYNTTIMCTLYNCANFIAIFFRLYLTL